MRGGIASKYFSKLSKDKIKKQFPSIVLMITVLICISSTLWSKKGLITLFSLENNLHQITKDLDTLRSERLKLENQAELLRSSSLDLDMLDEKARQILDFADSKELILIPNRNAH